MQDVFPEVTPPIGKNVLQLTGIQDSSNYTCVAASKLGIIERSTLVRVQGKMIKKIMFLVSFSNSQE
jgi:netrin-G3 ligand